MNNSPQTPGGHLRWLYDLISHSPIIWVWLKFDINQLSCCNTTSNQYTNLYPTLYLLFQLTYIQPIHTIIILIYKLPSLLYNLSFLSFNPYYPFPSYFIIPLFNIIHCLIHPLHPHVLNILHLSHNNLSLPFHSYWPQYYFIFTPLLLANFMLSPHITSICTYFKYTLPFHSSSPLPFTYTQTTSLVKKNLSYSYLFPSYPQNKRNKM